LVLKRSSHTKLIILEAAQRQFAHYGFAKVTMDEIANEIGMGKASLYYYFPTKENLFLEVVYREHDEFMNIVSAIVSDTLPASEKLIQYAEQRFNYFNKLINLNITEVRTAAKTKPMLKEVFKELAKRELKPIQTIIREGKATGEFQIHSVDQISSLILHIMQGLRKVFLRDVQQQVVEPEHLQLFKKESSLAMQIILTGICAPGKRTHLTNQ
jgi:AcrR family transcriptional regulator